MVRCTMSRISAVTRTDQKCLSLARSSLWKLQARAAGSTWRSKAVVLTAFCSSPVSRARLSVNVSAIRNCIAMPVTPTRNTFITSSPRWLITFTAIRPVDGLGKGRDVSLWRLSHASSSISALRVVFSAL